MVGARVAPVRLPDGFRAVAGLSVLLGVAIAVGAPVLGWLLIPLVVLIGVIVQLGTTLWLRIGPPAIIIAVVVFDGGVSELVVSSPLYQNATFSQAALRLQAVFVAAALLCALLLALFDRGHALPALGRLKPFEVAIVALAPLAAAGALVGLLMHNDLVYLVGDSYRLAIVPFGWLMVVWLVRDRRGIRAVLLSLVLVALLGLLFSLWRVLEAFAGGTTTYGIGVGSAPLLVIVGLLVLTYKTLSPARTALVTSTVVLALTLNLLSLSRNQMLGALVAIVAFAVLVGRRGARALGVLAVSAVAAGLLAVVAIPGVATQLDGMVDAAQRRVQAIGQDVGGTSPTENSISERGTEARDSFADLQREGVVGVFVGRGTGALFPTGLNPAGAQGVPAGSRHHIHITWASVLYRSGLVGLIVLALLVLGAITEAWRGARRARGPDDALMWGTVALWLVVTAVALNFAYGLVGELVWAIMLGLLSSLARLDRQAEAT